MTGPDRGQMVLVAAAVVAVALAPVVLAYLQLGYHPDVRASADYDAPVANAERVVERAVHEAGANATGDYNWSERSTAVDTVRRDLAPRFDRLQTSRLERGTAYGVGYNASAADTWAAANCPGSPNRQFGSCEADRGVVVQERANETVVLAAVLDLRVTTERSRTDVTLVVRVVGS